MNDIKASICCFIWIVFLASPGLLAQTDQNSKRNLKELAESAFEQKDYQLAIRYYSDYLDRVPEDIKRRFQLAESHRAYRNNKSAAKHYLLVAQHEKNKNGLADYYAARMLQSLGKCKEALPWYESFRKEYRGKSGYDRYLRMAKNQEQFCLGEFQEKPAEKRIVKPLGKDINGSHMEASPIVFGERQMIYNSLKIKGENSFDLNADSLPQRKFYMAERDGEGGWKHLGLALDDFDLEGREMANGAFNPDGTRFYFSACKTGLNGTMDCDIYVVNVEAGQKTPSRLPAEVNTRYTETQLAVGLDEKGRELLYFVSDRKGGKGGLDIWFSRYDSKRNTYKAARNAGSKINGPGDEMSPFFQARNRKLFFSSDGHPGYGGLDVFESIGAKSRWSEPINLGKSINTGADQLYYVEHKNGEEGFFVANENPNQRNSSSCCDDLYYFQFTDKVLVSFDASVFDEENKQPLEEAELSVYSYERQSQERFLEQKVKSNSDGSFQVLLEPNKTYLIQVEKAQFLSREFELQTPNKKEKIKREIYLQPITDKALVLENVYYKFDRSELTEAAKLTIDTTILPILIQNPSIIVEIGSHTDNKGTEAYNQKLSQKRAQSVVNYLRKNGIDRYRVKAKGYGMSQPIAENTLANGKDNPEGRAVNRRTEFKVIGYVEGLEEED